MTSHVDLFILLALTVAGCGGAAAASPPPGGPDEVLQGGHDEMMPPREPVDDGLPSGVAGHGEVCSSHDGAVSRPCAAGLSCCYPCGIQGCSSVCHTEEECRVDMMRP